MALQRGTIASISGHPMSGLWTLVFEDGGSAFIESGFGVRQLAACFGAREASGDLLDKIVGQEIVYCFDDTGLVLQSFAAAHPWDGVEFECNDCGATGPIDGCCANDSAGCPECGSNAVRRD